MFVCDTATTKALPGGNAFIECYVNVLLILAPSDCFVRMHGWPQSGPLLPVVQLVPLGPGST